MKEHLRFVSCRSLIRSHLPSCAILRLRSAHIEEWSHDSLKFSFSGSTTVVTSVQDSPVRLEHQVLLVGDESGVKQ